jgi:hypothetical protein
MRLVHRVVMQQLSLLGSLGQARHGGSSHYMRPDRVYRTSVLSPMTGYVPGYDVQMVAREFAMGPQTGMSLQGLGATPWDKVKGWWQGVKARARAGKMQAAMPAAAAQMPTVASEAVLSPPGASMPPQRTGWAGDLLAHGYSMAPAIVTAARVGPYARGVPDRMVTHAWGQSTALPAFAEEAAAKTTMMMWRGLRWPWG